VRLFAGIPLDDDARAYVAAAVDRLVITGVRARWIRPQNWHVTLAFLGDVDAARLPAVVDAFRTAAVRCEPFALRLSAVGAFPNERRPRVLWVGARDQPAGFVAAAALLRGAFAALGFGFDDEAVAHVTVGRADGRAHLDAPPLEGACECQVMRLALFESVRNAAGTHYVEREVVAMRNA
jgi:2'-5' RNA ligase